MAVFTFSDPQPVFTLASGKPSFLRRLFNASVDARMAQARSVVAEHVAATERDDKAVAKAETFDLDTAVVGKKGVYAWPF